MILMTGSIDYFGGDVDHGHYNSVSSAEACQQDCQVDRYCNLSSNNDDPQWKTITCHTFLTVREAFKYYFADIYFASKNPKKSVSDLGSPPLGKKIRKVVFDSFPKRPPRDASSGLGTRATTEPAGTSLLLTR